jgi:hypothetical protein
MAARTSVPNRRQQEQSRAAIKTSQLVNRLQNYALAQKDDENAVEIDTGRLKAIEILLRKSLPDLASLTVAGDEDSPLKHQHTVILDLG